MQENRELRSKHTHSWLIDVLAKAIRAAIGKRNLSNGARTIWYV
jgi:hypothetical protein